MPTDCDGCDCSCIEANVSYYEAAITVDNAAVTVAQNQLSADQTGYYYYLTQSYMCGCGMMAAAPGQVPKFMSPTPLTQEEQDLIAQELKDLREKQIERIVNSRKGSS